MLLGTITEEIASLRKDLDVVRIQLENPRRGLDEERFQRRKGVAAVRAELRPYQDTIMLFRKSIFEDLLKERNLHLQDTIDKRNLAAHGGDIMMDAKMVEQTADTYEVSKETELYQQTFKQLYGVRVRDLAFMARYKDMIHILNIRATVKLSDRQFDGVAAHEIQGLVEEAVTRFNDLDEVNLDDDFAQGQLGTLVKDIGTRYREEWRGSH